MTEHELLGRLAVALAVGLLVGLERGWQTRDETDHQRAAGLRTFALTGLLGGLSGAVTTLTSPVVLGFLFLGFAAAFTAFHLLEAREERDLSATSTVAGLLTFAIGAYAVLGDLVVAVASAVAMTVLLALREPLHRWVASLRWEEIRAVLILLAMTFLLLPIMPREPVDPWGAVDPAEIWILAILIAGLSFVGYVAVRILGDRLGIAVAALAGGLASSTATTLALSRLAHGRPGAEPVIAAGILLSSAVMVARVGVVVGLLADDLLPVLAPPLAAGALVMVLAALVLLRRGAGSGSLALEISNPLELGTALKLALLIAAVGIAASILRDWIGGAGVFAVAMLSGVADVDAATISVARMAERGLSLPTAGLAILATVAVNTVSKIVMAGWIGGTRLALPLGLASLLAAAAAGMLATQAG
jgi:uncharacterized membrane protein (DUF4010 family)